MIIVVGNQTFDTTKMKIVCAYRYRNMQCFDFIDVKVYEIGEVYIRCAHHYCEEWRLMLDESKLWEVGQRRNSDMEKIETCYLNKQDVNYLISKYGEYE